VELNSYLKSLNNRSVLSVLNDTFGTNRKKCHKKIFFPFLLPLSSIDLVFLSAEMVCFNQSLPTQGIAPGRWIAVHSGDYKSFCHSQTVVNLSAYMGNNTVQ